jgi:hypothetical protein
MRAFTTIILWCTTNGNWHLPTNFASVPAKLYWKQLGRDGEDIDGEMQ